MTSSDAFYLDLADGPFNGERIKVGDPVTEYAWLVYPRGLPVSALSDPEHRCVYERAEGWRFDGDAWVARADYKDNE